MGWGVIVWCGVWEAVGWDDWRLVWVLSENVVQLRQMHVI